MLFFTVLGRTALGNFIFHENLSLINIVGILMSIIALILISI